MDDEPRIIIPWQGRKQVIRLKGLTAEDDQAVYDKTGWSVTSIFTREEAPLFVVAGLLWAHLRKRNSELAYETVAGQFSLGDYAGIDYQDVEDEEAPAEGSSPSVGGR